MGYNTVMGLDGSEILNLFCMKMLRFHIIFRNDYIE